MAADAERWRPSYPLPEARDEMVLRSTVLRFASDPDTGPVFYATASASSSRLGTEASCRSSADRARGHNTTRLPLDES
jgi:hypothetical protein